MDPAVSVVPIEHIAVWQEEQSSDWRTRCARLAVVRAGPEEAAEGGQGQVPVQRDSPGSTAPRMIPRTLEEFLSSR
jgi:hypothetical protein